MKKYIGDKAFYKMVLLLAIPMVIQQGITNFVNLLDNIMVGKLNTEAISGVAISNQLMFVFNITIFGGISGASILGAQFYGRGDEEGVKHTFRFKCIVGTAFLTLALIIFLAFDRQLITLYLSESSDGKGDLALTLQYARNYLRILLISLPPFIISQCYSSTMKDTGETVIPMVGSVIAVVVNFCLNLILIFGLLGAPKMGVLGAAVATVVSRYAEMLYMVIKTRMNVNRFPYFHHVLQNMKIPKEIVKKILMTSWPLMINEFLWSVGQATLSRNYSLRGLDVVAAYSISSTISNLFFVVCMAMGGVISIVIGQLLGAGKIEEAKDTDRKLLFFNVVMHIVIGACLIGVSGIIPSVYETSDHVKHLATQFLIVYALALPINAYNHGTYFTMRSGGKTFVTFLFDSGCTWAVSIPLAFILVHTTSLPIITIYFIVLYADAVKCLVGHFMLKSGVWAKKIVHTEDA